MIRYQKGRILNTCSICVLYIFIFKIDIFSSYNNTINNNIENNNSCTEDNYFFSADFQEPSFLLGEEYNPGNDMENRSYIKDIINGEKDCNQEGINMVEQNIYDDKNIEGNNILCCSSDFPLKNQKNFETNYNFGNYIDEGKGVANTSIRIKKKDLKLENLLLKKRKRRTNESIDNSKKNLANRKTNRGRYKKNDQSSINYVPNVNDYSDVRHSRYSLDNIIFKIKTLIINEIIRFLNNKITEFYKWEDFYELLSQKTIIPPTFKYMFNQKSILFNLNGEFIRRMKKEHDKILLNQKIGVILSNEISGKCKKYDRYHNKLIIKVIQGNDEIKKILDLTFLDCVKHFSLKEKNGNLIGFTDWNTYAKQIEEKNGKEYKNCFYDVLSKFEKFVNSCWSRGKNKK